MGKKKTASLLAAGLVLLFIISGCRLPSGRSDSATTCAEVTFSPAAGSYTSDQLIELSTATAGAEIYYTTDGTMPSTASAKYSGKLSFTGDGATMTVRAIAVRVGLASSTPSSATYQMAAYSDRVPGYWKNGNWFGLPRLDNTKRANVLSIAVGYSTDTASLIRACYWKNGILYPTAPANSQTYFYGIAIAANGDVYTCGSGGTGSASDPYYAGYCVNGGSPTILTGIPGGKGSEALAIAISGSNVYICGYSLDSSGVAVPGYWINGTWTELPPYATGFDGMAEAITISDGDVYIGGYSCNSSKQEIPGYWLNGFWVGPTKTLSNDYEISALSVDGSNTYLVFDSYPSTSPKTCGLTTDITSDTAWVTLKALDGTRNSIALGSALQGSAIYICGYSVNSSGVSVPVYWFGTGTTISDPVQLPMLNPAKAGSATCITASGGDAYIGGYSTIR
jgi:hypothetical protein